ncbi:MAG TPA: FHA domain-containing protein, partial [Phycisphaerae bacterium]|nr:FHA domain-containing protein [Phycisphaerae bacterium]
MEIWTFNQYTDKRDVISVNPGDITIGRDDENTVSLQSPFVSRKHARIFKDSGSFYIECLGMNPITVANNEILSPAKK